jgi:hypothetical protein
MNEYIAIYLKRRKADVNAPRPSVRRQINELISVTCEVNGAAIDASVSANEIEIEAAFKAPESLAPSPTKLL